MITPTEIIEGAMILSLIVAGTFILEERSQIEILHHENAVLDDKINNPSTGYVVRLAQARANTVTVSAAVDQENAAVEKMSTDLAQHLAVSEAQIAANSPDFQSIQQQVGAIIAEKPSGKTTCDRVTSVDKEFLVDLTKPKASNAPTVAHPAPAASGSVRPKHRT